MLQPFDPILDAEESLLHTTDINMANGRSPVPPVQGGFLVIRPDLAVFEQLTEASARRQRLALGPFPLGRSFLPCVHPSGCKVARWPRRLSVLEIDRVALSPGPKTRSVEQGPMVAMIYRTLSSLTLRSLTLRSNSFGVARF